MGTLRLENPGALLTLDRATGSLRSRVYHLSVLSGRDEGRAVTLEGPTVVGTALGSTLLLTDEAVSGTHLELTPLAEGVRVRDLGSTNGTFIGGARITEALLGKEATVSVGRTVLRLFIFDEQVAVPELGAELEGVIGKSAAMRRLLAMLRKVATSTSPVVLLGETGTGKEVLARATHRLSARSDKPFVVFDCAAVSANLIESELFGHVKGAFTGASEDRRGAFLEAQHGTLFLDELGELPLELQPKLLRVLEDSTVKPVGSERTQKVDVRIVAATHRDLEAEVAAGRFRADLFFRLYVVPLTVPPLRDRPEDVPALARHFVAQLGASDVELPAPLVQKLCAYAWPGNVRELRNVVARALVDEDLALMGGQPKAPAGASVTPDVELPFKEAKERLIDAFTRDYLEATLARHHGNITHAAKAAGIARAHLHKLVERYGLKATP